MSSSPQLHCLQAGGVLYFNLASILWTSCFAFTLHRDIVPSYRRHALRKYECYFHLICWPLPAILAGGAALSDAGSWSALGPAYLPQSLVAFYVPLVCAFAFNAIIFAMLFAHAAERRVSRTTSLYLLAFVVTWLPSLLVLLQVFAGGVGPKPSFPLAAVEAVCMPLQGALNAAVFAWSLPSVRDTYRTMLLGTDNINTGDIIRNLSQLTPSPPESEYSPPTSDGYATPGVYEVSFGM